MNEHQQAVFEDYKITGSTTTTGNKFGISRQRVHQIIKLFGYKKPKPHKPTREEKFNSRKERAIVRFWNRIDKKSDTDCWEWKGSRLPSGYGHCNMRFSLKEKMKNQNCHRLAWIFTNGEIPDGFIVCHKCDNPACCNPNHLYLGTYTENARDRDERFYQNGKVPIRKKDRIPA